MSAIQYKDGGVTISLDGDLAKWAEAAVQQAAGAAIDIVRAELDAVASSAEASWYGPQGVQRVTGKSGQMAVTTTIDAAKGVIRVTVGSTDTRVSSKGTKYSRADGTTGQRTAGVPIPFFVHRPDRLATELQVVSRSQYYAAPPSTRLCRAERDGSTWKVPAPHIKAGDYVLRVSSPRASDGKKLSPLFVFAPGKRAIAAALPKIGAAMAATATATEVPRA